MMGSLRPTSDVTLPFACPRRSVPISQGGAAGLWWQSVGVVCVFGGLFLGIQAHYAAKNRQQGPLESPRASIEVVPMNAVDEDMKLIHRG